MRPLPSDTSDTSKTTNNMEGPAASTTESDAKMPPKKRSRYPPRATSTMDEDAMDIDSPATETPNPIDEPAKRNEQLDDPWSDEQETSLFKGLIRWKPNGNHASPVINYGSNVLRHTQTLSNDRIV